MSLGDPCDEHPALHLDELGCNLQHLLRRFTFPKNDLGKSAPQRAMSVHLRKPQVGDRRRLKRFEHFITAYTAGSKFFQQLNCFRCGHSAKMPQPLLRVTQENSWCDFSAGRDPSCATRIDIDA